MSKDDSWERFVLTPEDVTFGHIEYTPEELAQNKIDVQKAMDFMFEKLVPLKKTTHK